MVELKFVNSDARPKVAIIQCNGQSIAPIMAWYGAYYAWRRRNPFLKGVRQWRWLID